MNTCNVYARTGAVLDVAGAGLDVAGVGLDVAEIGSGPGA